MTNITQYTTDDLGTKWVDDTGLFAEDAGACFMCKEWTHRVDISFGTFYCNSDACNKAIEDDLRKYPEQGVLRLG